MSCYLVQEIDGVSRFELEDGTGFLLLEACIPVTPPTPGMGGEPRKGRRRRLEQITEEDLLATVLAEM